MSPFSVGLFLFAVSQIYWAWRGYRFLSARVRSVPLRAVICVAVVTIFSLLYQLNVGAWRHRSTTTYLTPWDIWVASPFLWWMPSSLVAFLLVLILAIPKGIAAAIRRLRRPELASPSRREFLGRTTAVVSAAPFLAGGYGLLYGRLNLETTNPAIRLAKLPRAFDGFRICQLSDIHIGPYMPADEIRRYVAIANHQKADLIVLTGDFVTFDPSTEKPLVEALSGLNAPFGIWGCLGNHDMWT